MRLPLALAIATGVATLAPDFQAGSLSPARAEAAVSIDLDLNELLRASRLVVLATVQDHHSLWEEDENAERRIVTYTRVRIERTLDGEAKTSEEVYVRTFGGEVGSIGQRVEGEAVLVPGQSSLLFLHPRGDGTHSVAAMALGQYLVERGEDGAARLRPSPNSGLVLRKLGRSGPYAREILAGKTIDEAAAIIATARRNHAR